MNQVEKVEEIEKVEVEEVEKVEAEEIVDTKLNFYKFKCFITCNLFSFTFNLMLSFSHKY